MGAMDLADTNGDGCFPFTTLPSVVAVTVSPTEPSCICGRIDRVEGLAVECCISYSIIPALMASRVDGVTMVEAFHPPGPSPIEGNAVADLVVRALIELGILMMDPIVGLGSAAVEVTRVGFLVAEGVGVESTVVPKSISVIVTVTVFATGQLGSLPTRGLEIASEVISLPCVVNFFPAK